MPVRSAISSTLSSTSLGSCSAVAALEAFIAMPQISSGSLSTVLTHASTSMSSKLRKTAPCSSSPPTAALMAMRMRIDAGSITFRL